MDSDKIFVPLRGTANYGTLYSEYLQPMRICDKIDDIQLPVNLNSIQLLASWSYFSKDNPQAFCSDDSHSIISASEYATNTAIIRIPRLLKGHKIRIRWILACHNIKCLNEFASGYVGWKLPQLKMKLEDNPCVNVPLKDENGSDKITLTGPTSIEQDICLSASYMLVYEASRFINMEYKEELQDFSSTMYFYAYLIVEDLVNNICHPILELNQEVECFNYTGKTGLVTEHCYRISVDKPPSRLDVDRALTEPNIYDSLCLVWFPKNVGRAVTLTSWDENAQEEYCKRAQERIEKSKYSAKFLC